MAELLTALSSFSLNARLSAGEVAARFWVLDGIDSPQLLTALMVSSTATMLWALLHSLLFKDDVIAQSWWHSWPWFRVPTFLSWRSLAVVASTTCFHQARSDLRGPPQILAFPNSPSGVLSEMLLSPHVVFEDYGCVPCDRPACWPRRARLNPQLTIIFVWLSSGFHPVLASKGILTLQREICYYY